MNKDFYSKGVFYSFSDNYFIANDGKFTYDEVTSVRYTTTLTGKRILCIGHLKMAFDIEETGENKDTLAEIYRFTQQKMAEAKVVEAEKEVARLAASPQTSEPTQADSIEALLKEQISIQRRSAEHLNTIKIIIIVIICINILAGIIGCTAFSDLTTDI